MNHNINKRKVIYNDNRVSRRKRLIIILSFIALLIVMILFNVTIRGKERVLGLYSLVMLTYLSVKMILSLFYKPYQNKAPQLKVSVVIPSFNEANDVLKKTLESILDQTYPVEEIFVVDDGSNDISGYICVKKFIEEHSERCKNVTLHRLKENRGKRGAQSWAFKRATGDVFFTVDSDGYTHPYALEELMKPFIDEDVYAVTGHINARNRDENILTKLLDIRYENAFRLERAAQSVTGNILVCSGPISCYRREVVIPNLEHYNNQKFLGEVVQAGDDRCLTNYAIALGKTVYQSGARCDTDVPSTLKMFIKQQIRWNKSFFRESLQGLKLAFKKPKVAVWILLELSLWIVFSVMMVISLLNQYASMSIMILMYALFSLVVSALIRNVYYIVKNPLLFLMSPLYGFLHLLLLFPLRFYSLITLRNVKWGTRSNDKI